MLLHFFYFIGGGSFVVGQEQDSGGVFSSSESFVGKLTTLNIWDEELPLSTVEAIGTSCDKRVGNVIAWPDIKMGLHGSLVAESSNFCRGKQGNSWWRTVLIASSVSYHEGTPNAAGLSNAASLFIISKLGSKYLKKLRASAFTFHSADV